jgi:hypothetical protein
MGWDERRWDGMGWDEMEVESARVLLDDARGGADLQSSQVKSSQVKYFWMTRVAEQTSSQVKSSQVLLDDARGGAELLEGLADDLPKVVRRSDEMGGMG